MLKIHDTLTGSLREFNKKPGEEVRFYACGPTVYDFAHIGNFRTFVFEDLLRRFLEFQNYRVQHCMNITDVDDKTIAGANREKIPLEQYTAPYVRAFNEDLKTLNCLPPSIQPRATDPAEMKAMQDLIAALMKKDLAYVHDGSVYYRVAKFPGYGKLSKKKLECNIAGASERMDSDEYEAKENVTDFVLWKKAKAGEPSWDSLWGKGRPGWHIECSAMSIRHLGETFDLHAGGEDLVFPHHENEIAQSEGATGKPFVQYWVHSKFLLVDGRKMSKSAGNFYTLRDLLAKGYDPMAIRYALIATHYRTPLNFTLRGLTEASEMIKKLDDCYWQCLNRTSSFVIGQELNASITNIDLITPLQEVLKNIIDALESDLNISVALAQTHEGLSQINQIIAKNAMTHSNLGAAIKYFQVLDRLFGFDIALNESPPNDVSGQFLTRRQIREDLEFSKDKSLQTMSDKMRDSIFAQGWRVYDASQFSTLKKRRRVWD